MAGKVSKIIKFTFFAVLAAFLFGVILMYLWNWLVPDIFGGPQLSLLQAVGLLILSKILFGGFGSRFAHKRDMWKKHYENKLARMDPEEREKFKQNLQNCFREKQKTDPDK